MITVHSSLALANVARNSLGIDPPFKERGPIACVFSVAWVEAFFNELLEHISTNPIYHLTDGARHLRSLVESTRLFSKALSVSDKVQSIKVMLSGTPFETGSQPFQDFELLVAVRNALLHNRPEILSVVAPPRPDGAYELEVSRLAKRLYSRGVVPRPAAGTVDTFIGVVHSAPFGPWAYNSAARLLRAFRDSAPDSRANWYIAATEALYDVPGAAV